VFDEPDRFRIDRKPNRHIALGMKVLAVVGNRMPSAWPPAAWMRPWLRDTTGDGTPVASGR
jgi:hypothetical protein